MSKLRGYSNTNGRIVSEYENDDDETNWRMFTSGYEGYSIVVVHNDDYRGEAVWHFPKNWDLI